jgi:protein-disulfide isomerase
MAGIRSGVNGTPTFFINGRLANCIELTAIMESAGGSRYI